MIDKIRLFEQVMMPVSPQKRAQNEIQSNPDVVVHIGEEDSRKKPAQQHTAGKNEEQREEGQQPEDAMAGPDHQPQPEDAKIDVLV